MRNVQILIHLEDTKLEHTLPYILSASLKGNKHVRNRKLKYEVHPSNRMQALLGAGSGGIQLADTKREVF